MQAAPQYYHFGSREEMIEEVVRAGVDRVAGHVSAALSTLSPCAGPLDRLDAAVEAHLRFCLPEPDLTLAAIRNTGQLPAEMALRQRAAESAYGQVWRDLRASARDCGLLGDDQDPRVVRVLGALNHATEWSDSDRSTDRLITTARLMMRKALTRTAR